MKAAFILPALFLAHTASAAVLVTEFLPDPSGTDIDREWFEIYNAGDAPFDLTGYAAGDGINPTSTSAGEGMGVFPPGTVMDPGDVFVIAANAYGFFSLYSFLPTFEFANSTSTLGNHPDVPDLPQKADWGLATATLAIANGGDDIGILPPDSTIASFTFIDGTNHGTVNGFFTGAPALTANQSYERFPANQDTDTASDWLVRTSGTATPGLVFIPEPTSLSLVMLGIGTAAAARRRRR